MPALEELSHREMQTKEQTSNICLKVASGTFWDGGSVGQKEERAPLCLQLEGGRIRAVSPAQVYREHERRTRDIVALV